eukprot:Opistho-2@67967
MTSCCQGECRAIRRTAPTGLCGLRPMPTSPSWPFGFNPYRSCALRLPPGENPAASPRRAMLGAPEVPEPAAPDRPRQRGRTLWRVTLLRHSLPMYSALI